MNPANVRRAGRFVLSSAPMYSLCLESSSLATLYFLLQGPCQGQLLARCDIGKRRFTFPKVRNTIQNL